jgi:glycosyltransferase involved in cell wall biosynthesis
MRRGVLVVTPYGPNLLPTQGIIIAEQLSKVGLPVAVIGKGRSGRQRLLDVLVRGLILVPRYGTVLVNIYGERAFVYESAAILYARMWKKRIVALIHSGIMPAFVRRWPAWSRFVLRMADVVVVPHGFLQEQLSQLGLRIDGVIPNFIDIEPYKFRERAALEPRFLYLRGMHPIYNPAMALRAFAHIQQVYPDAFLTMAGPEGADSAYCRELVRSLKLHNVHFVGLVPKDEIPALADRHEIHLHTNRVENMPVSIIEMWACGLPIVGTNVGGMPYLVRHRVDGILVDSDDDRAMANACLELLSDRELARTLSRNGRARAEALTWEKIKPAWEKVLLSPGRGGAASAAARRS